MAGAPGHVDVVYLPYLPLMYSAYLGSSFCRQSKDFEVFGARLPLALPSFQR
jgi:hypothetical protein